MLSSFLTTVQVPLSKALGVSKCLRAVDGCDTRQLPIFKVKHFVEIVLMFDNYI